MLGNKGGCLEGRKINKFIKEKSIKSLKDFHLI